MTDKEALANYSLLFQRLVKVGMQLKPSKRTFYAREIEILRHRITQEGHTLIIKGVEAISSQTFSRTLWIFKRLQSLYVYPNTSLAKPPQKGCIIAVDRRNRKTVSRLKEAITGPMWCCSIRIGTLSLNHMWTLAILDVELCWLRRRMAYFAL